MNLLNFDQKLDKKANFDRPKVMKDKGPLLIWEKIQSSLKQILLTCSGQEVGLTILYSKIPIIRPPFGLFKKWSLRPLLNSPKGGFFLEDAEFRKHTERMTETF